MTRITIASLAAVAILTGGFVISPPTAAPTEALNLPVAEPEEVALPETSPETIPFDHPVTVTDAVAIAQDHEIDAIAIDIANPTVVGGYGLACGQTVDEYEAWFQSQFGTLPQATGLVVEVPTPPLTDGTLNAQ